MIDSQITHNWWIVYHLKPLYSLDLFETIRTVEKSEVNEVSVNLSFFVRTEVKSWQSPDMSGKVNERKEYSRPLHNLDVRPGYRKYVSQCLSFVTIQDPTMDITVRIGRGETDYDSELLQFRSVLTPGQVSIRDEVVNKIRRSLEILTID